MKKRLHKILFECFLLLEYDYDKTVKNHGQGLLDRLKAVGTAARIGRTHIEHPVEERAHHHHFRGRPDDAVNTLMKHFEDSDPSPQKKHVSTIARIYSKGGVKNFEDIKSRLGPALHDHHELSKRKIIPPEHRDAGRFKSLDDVESVVEKHGGVLSGKQTSANQHDKMKSESTIEEHGSFTKIIPHTKEAASHFGKGTRWCTATKDLNNSMFDYYNKDGPMHIMIPRSPSHAGEKYQYHKSSNQLMDEKDNSVSRNNLPHEMKHHLDLYDQHVEHAKNNPELSKNHLEKDVRDHYYANHATKDEVDHAISHYNNDGFVAAHANAHVDREKTSNILKLDTQKHVDKHWESDPDLKDESDFPNEEDWRDHVYSITGKIEDNIERGKFAVASNNKHVDKDMFNDVAEHAKRFGYNSSAISGMLRNKNLSSNDLHDIIDSHKNNKEIIRNIDSIVHNPNHNEEHSEKILNHIENDKNRHTFSTREVLTRGKLKYKTAHKYLSSILTNERLAVVCNPNSAPEHYKKGLKDSEHAIRIAARMRVAGHHIDHPYMGGLDPMVRDSTDTDEFDDHRWDSHPKNPDRK